MPVAELVAASINISSALTSLDRIQDFLNQDLTSSRVQNNEQADGHQPLVSMRSCSLDWGCSEDKAPVLTDINFDLRRSEFVLILGPVGCGKTLLLNSMIGEARIAAGSLLRSTSTRVSYSAQTPWITNTTLRELVLGQAAYDARRYAQVTKICQLSEDFASFEKGDGSMAGSNGSKLSGGQKQRLVSFHFSFLP